MSKREFVDTHTDLVKLIQTVDDSRSALLFGELWDDSGTEVGNFTEITCVMGKAAAHLEAAEMELRHVHLMMMAKARTTND